jgi:hypothetical protein
MPHYVTLSPFEWHHPYVFYAVRWISSLACIFFSLHFCRKGKGVWWLMVAAAFALPLLAETAICLRHGLPPLPYGLQTHQDVFPWNPIAPTKSFGSWSFIPPCMALALAWAWLDEKNTRR